jgi:hypothetical protein
MISRWVTSEVEPRNHHEGSQKKNVISLQPRLDAIRSHMTEQIADLGSYLSETTLNNDKFHDENCFQLRECFVYTSLPFHSSSIDQKCNRITRVSKILLERLSEQLKSVTDLGDIVVILSPAVPVLKSIRSSLIQCKPESYQELCYICELMEVVLVDAAQIGGYTINFQTANESARQWITELAAIDCRTNENA